MSTRVRAICNPRAGVAAERALAAVHAHGTGWDVEVVATAGPGHATVLAREAVAAGAPVVLAVGGDGTANETATGLLDSETALGVVPVGSGNGLARALGIPLRPEDALRVLASCVRRRMDVGTANGRPFLNVAGAGFDAAVGAEFHAHGRRGGRRGLFTYVRLGVRRALSYEAARWRLAASGGAFEGGAFVLTFANGPQYGGAAVIAPGARLDDGLLDVAVVEAAPTWELLANAARLYTGGIAAYPRYRRFAAAEAVLTSDGPFAHHRDGEPEAPAERLEVGLRAKALAVLVPEAVAGDPAGPFGR